jgi:hypothetical protein
MLLLPPHGIYRRVVCMWTDVSEERITSIFRVENQPSKKPACIRWLGRLPQTPGIFIQIMYTKLYFTYVVVKCPVYLYRTLLWENWRQICKLFGDWKCYRLCPGFSCTYTYASNYSFFPISSIQPPTHQFARLEIYLPIHASAICLWVYL